MGVNNPNFDFINTNKSAKRYLLLQGGTRSGKTYSTCQFIIKTCFEYKKAGLIISICRKTMPSLKATVMRDFVSILSEYNLYNENSHNKSEGVYQLFGNYVEFINLDDEQKVRGRKRNILYVNEANENSIDVIRQLLFRTSGLCVFDYNPTILPDHWLITDILNRKESDRIITTYKDNPYLSEAQAQEIEHLKKIDNELWKVFGLGEIGTGLKGTVFKDWQYGQYEGKAKISYGLDFGFSPDPLALIEVAMQGKNVYLREVIYKTNLDADDIKRLVGELVPRGTPCICDHRSDLVQMLFKAGVNAKLATKGKDSIDTGIKTMQNFSIFVHPDSHNIAKELKYYRYKEDKDGNPIGGKYTESLNHAIDSARYALTSMVHVPSKGFQSFTTSI